MSLLLEPSLITTIFFCLLKGSTWLNVQLFAKTGYVMLRIAGDLRTDSTACLIVLYAQYYFFKLSQQSRRGIRHFQTEFSEAVLHLDSCELFMHSRVLGTFPS